MLDPLAVAVLAALVGLAAVGGIDLTGLGIPFTAHGLAPLGVLLVLVIVARLAADPVTALREVPLVERIGAWTEHPRLRHPAVLPSAAAAFVVLVGAAACARHATFRSNGYDLGLFENVLWNTSQGRWLASDVLGRSFLGEHLSPILLPIALVYKVLPTTETLLVLQAVALALGVFPVVRLARAEIRHEPLAQVFGLAYLLYVPLRSVALFDFHPVAFAVPLLLEGFASVREGRGGRALLACGLALAAKETVAIPVAALGVYAIVVMRARPLGAALVVVALVWFAAYVGWIAPSVRGEAYPFAARYAALAEGRIGALVSFDRLGLLVLLLGPFAFLPLLSPAHLLLAAVPLSMHLLSSDPHQHRIEFHYMSTAIPFVVAAAVMGAKNLINRDDLRVVLAYYPTRAQAQQYVSALLLLGTAVFALWSPVTEIREGWGAHRSSIRTVLASVPADAALSAQGNLLPHLARRRDVGIFPWHAAEWVALDRDGNPWPFARRAHLRAAVDRVVSDPGCVVEAQSDGVVLLRCDPEARARIAAIEVPPRDASQSS